MKTSYRLILLLLLFVKPIVCCAALLAGIGKADMTPPIGTPSAGYHARKGEGMEGKHDPLLATSLFISNGEKQLIFCGVDHLGFTHMMVKEIIEKVHSFPELVNCEIYLGSSHTHSGGGAYLNIPLISEGLAGQYNPEIAKFYVEKTVEAIVLSSQNPQPAKLGVGYGNAQNLSQYRGSWPQGANPLSDIAVIKVTNKNDTPLAVLFNYPVHPTVLPHQNRLFSSDFVGYARNHLKHLLGPEVQPIYFNGAQGDINPVIFAEEDRFLSCDILGQSLAQSVNEIWNETETYDTLQIQTQKKSYSFTPLSTPFGLTLPLENYNSEINLIVLNKMHAFVTIPGELSTVYDNQLKEIGKTFGYKQVSIFGLTNDAHGYIISPESWKHKTFESRLSFGGENYGEMIKEQAETLLKNQAPNLNPDI